MEYQVFLTTAHLSHAILLLNISVSEMAFVCADWSIVSSDVICDD